MIGASAITVINNARSDATGIVAATCIAVLIVAALVFFTIKIYKALKQRLARSRAKKYIQAGESTRALAELYESFGASGIKIYDEIAARVK